jgi:large subunit ribosomal protein L24e
MKCSFCGSEIKKGTGVLFVKADGSTFAFCSSKCRQNQLSLKRSGIKIKWTKAYKEFRDINKGKKAKGRLNGKDPDTDKARRD